MNKISLFLSLSLVAACGNPAKEAQNKGEEKGLDLSAMDTLVRPQDDFYNYVSGSWMKTAKIPADKPAADLLGLSKMLNFWPFILVYFWMTMLVGEITIKQTARFSWRRLPVITSHLGLFIALTCATLGSADMQRLKMYCEKGQPEWRGLDAYNNVHELPIAIQLNRFTIDEYPPKLMVLDKMGRPIPYKKPEVLLIDDHFKQGSIAGWHIQVDKKIEDAVPALLAGMIKNMPKQMQGMLHMDSLGMAMKKGGYIKSSMAGSACAISITATKGNVMKKGSSLANFARSIIRGIDLSNTFFE